MVVSFLWLFSLAKNGLVVFLNVAFRLERWSNFWCDGNGLFFEAMRCFLDKRYYRYWCDYLDLTIVDDVFSIFGFSCFWMVFMVLCFFQGFSILGFTIANYAILLLIYQDRYFCHFIEVYWPSYAIICDGRHTSVKWCDVSFKSIPIYVDDLFADHPCLSSDYLPIPIDMISAFTMPFVLIISKH